MNNSLGEDLYMKKTYKNRWLALYFSAFIYLGLASAVIGPSFIRLVEKTGSTVSSLSIIFPIRSAAYLFGSWLAGKLYDRSGGHQLLTGSIVVLGITLGLIPLISEPLSLIWILLVMGLAMSLIDVGGNVLLIRVQSTNLGPAMNALHFFYGLGSFFAPIILVSTIKFADGLQWGYWGLALFSLPVLGQLIFLPTPERLDLQTSNIDRDSQVESPNLKLLIVVIALFFFSFVGVELGFGDWISTYAIRMGIADERAAVFMASAYWGAFTISRLISIPLSTRFQPEKLVFADLIGSFIGLGLILVFPGQSIMAWCGTIILGLSVASLFPTMLTLADNFVPMTGKITSWFLISGSLGSMFVPWLIGRNVESSGPLVIIQVLFLLLLISGLMFFLLTRLQKKHPQDNLRV